MNGTTYDLSHLEAFVAAIPGKGVNTVDLAILVVFSNHVFTERTKHGDPYDIVDQNDVRRTFDLQRYMMSKGLGAAIRQKIQANDLTYVSKSFGGAENLVLLEDDKGQTWTIVYCLYPHSEIAEVRMEVLSCHPKVVHQREISRRHLSYYARKCIFKETRMPKE